MKYSKLSYLARACSTLISWPSISVPFNLSMASSTPSWSAIVTNANPLSKLVKLQIYFITAATNGNAQKPAKWIYLISNTFDQRIYTQVQISKIFLENIYPRVEKHLPFPVMYTSSTFPHLPNSSSNRSLGHLELTPYTNSLVMMNIR